MILALCLLMAPTVLGIDGNRWTGPSNTAAVVGDQVTMTCLPSIAFESIDWRYTPFASNTESLICQGGNVLDRMRQNFAVNELGKGQQLVLKSARIEQAGVYACNAFAHSPNGAGGKETPSTAHLTILETNPFCTLSNATSKEGDSIEMKCSVKFHGAYAPTMLWMEHKAADSENGSTISNGLTETVIRNGTLTSTTRFRADQAIHNSSFSCTTHFETNAMLSAVNATNAPNFTFTWRSPRFEIIYGPKRITITPKQDAYDPGDSLWCSAEGNPGVEFEWTNVETGEIHRNRELIIRSSMSSGVPQRYNCTARNILTKTELTSDMVIFTVQTKAEASFHLILTAAIACCLLGVVVVLIAYIGCMKKKKRNSNNTVVAFNQNGVASIVQMGHDKTTSRRLTTGCGDYSEIQAYGTCREAMERCDYPSSSSFCNNLGQPTPGYLSHSHGSSCMSPQGTGYALLSHHSNIYLQPNEDSDNPRYSVVMKSRAASPGDTRCKEVHMTDGCYADMSGSSPPTEHYYNSPTATKQGKERREAPSRRPDAARSQADKDVYLQPTQSPKGRL